jgi:hypothetical protein
MSKFRPLNEKPLYNDFYHPIKYHNQIGLGIEGQHIQIEFELFPAAIKRKSWAESPANHNQTKILL